MKQRLSSFPTLGFNPKFGTVALERESYFCNLTVVVLNQEIFIHTNVAPKHYQAVLNFANDIIERLGYLHALLLIDRHDESRIKAALAEGYIEMKNHDIDSLNLQYVKHFEGTDMH